MTEEEFDATEQGRAIDSFLKYTMSLAMVWAGSELGSLLPRGLGALARLALDKPEVLRALGTKAEPLERLKANEKYIRMFDGDYDESVRNSMTVIGACSAIEACIEDISKAIIRSTPTILDGTPFDANVLRQKFSLVDAEGVLDKQWRRITGTTDRELPLCDRFEAMLQVIGRSEPVPPVIQTAFNTAYAVRNVWAHNAGYVDLNFIEKAPQLGFQIGELVVLRTKDETATQYLSAIMTYGMIVANRERGVYGLGPIPMNGKPGETDFGLAYKALYSDHV
jgi:hypothetical protein